MFNRNSFRVMSPARYIATLTGALALAALSWTGVVAQINNPSGVRTSGAMVVGNCLKYGPGTNQVQDAGGACNTSATPTGANPTASLGLSAINGVSGNFMRSDAAPALSQSIAPVWSGKHEFTNATGVRITTPGNIGFDILGGSNGGVTLPVPTFYPVANNTLMAVDFSPKGTPADGGYGIAWNDICNTDQIQFGASPSNCLHLAARSTSMEVSTAKYNPGSGCMPLNLGTRIDGAFTNVLQVTCSNTVTINGTIPALSVPTPLQLSAGAVSWAGLTSGGVLYASSATGVASSGVLANTYIMLGGGAGGAPTTASGCNILSGVSLNCIANSSGNPSWYTENSTNDAGSASITFAKSRASGDVLSGDGIGNLNLNAWFNGSFRFGTKIFSSVDGSPAGTFIPTKWTLSTGDNASFLSQNFYFNAQGRLNITTRTSPAAGTCGTSPAITAGSTDFAGEITVGTATPTSCTINFTTVAAFGQRPFCTVVSAPQLAAFTYTVSTTQIVVTQTATSSNKITWHCIGN